MENIRRKPIAILGAGSWGTALALHLSRVGQEVRLWSYDPKHITTMAEERANNRYLPGCLFPDSLHPIVNLADALHDITDILVAVPSVGFRDTLLAIKPLLTHRKRIVWATKGMDIQSNQLLHELVLDILGDKHIYAVLSGPSYAKEVALGLPTAVVIASENTLFANDLIKRFNSDAFRCYLSTDIVGVEVSGIVKNVLAIAIGISDGMGFGSNARSAMITRGLAEMTRLGVALGGKQETFMGLAGLGDLVLTCTDDQSRNRRFGLALGKGKSPHEAEKEIKQIVEGKRNAELIVSLAKKLCVDMPITESVWKILESKLTLKEAMHQLLSRETKSE
jgi:glycerol-3-phosphate dehydrogenase (NAD(P)+)